MAEMGGASHAAGATAVQGLALEAPQSMNYECEFEDVTKSFSVDRHDFVAVSNINLAIERGRFISIIGPSGCGKSTLLNMLSGLMAPTSGVVRYQGQPLRRVNTDVGYMTQHDDLLPWRTLERNVGISLEIQRIAKAERTERVREILSQVGLAGFEHRYPSQLSGGMRKRAVIARTLVYEPATLLMDEPFGALDAQLRLVLQGDLLRLWERDRKTVLFVTHDLDEAISLSDSVVVFASNPGRIVHIEHLDFPRPRDLVDLRSQPDFVAIRHRLWNFLNQEEGCS